MYIVLPLVGFYNGDVLGLRPVLPKLAEVLHRVTRRIGRVPRIGRAPRAGPPYGHQALVEDTVDVVTQLRHSQFFSGFSDSQLKEIADLSVVRAYGEQEVIFNQGDPANSLYVVAAGNVALVRQITKAITGEKMQVTVDIVQAGQSLGWSALVEPHGYTVSARALGRVVLIVIDSETLNAWLQRSTTAEMQVFKNLITLLVQRLRRAYDTLNLAEPLQVPEPEKTLQPEHRTVEEVHQRIKALGLSTPSESVTMIREDRDAR